MIAKLVYAALAFADATAPAAAPVPAAAQPSTMGMLLPFALMFAVFYFLMIRPQQKKLKEHETLVGSLQKGEEVITNAGIFGKIHGIADKFITLEVDNNVRIKVLKNQIATVLRGEQKA
jgi:preprotein translocase subunit YajC